jgi:hypothetical protein
MKVIRAKPLEVSLKKVSNWIGDGNARLPNLRCWDIGVPIMGMMV